MRFGVSTLAIACIAILGWPRLHAQSRNAVVHVTVPMSVEGNAPIVTLKFKRQDGGSRTARFIFDSGGGAIIVDEGLATALGLKPEGAELSEDGQRFRAVNVPAAHVGRMPVDLRTSKAFVHLGATSFTNRETVEGLLPGKALEHYQIVLDYPRQLLSIGEPGTIPHQGEPLSSPYVASSGHPRVEVSIGGLTYGFLLDTGTKLTLLREDLLQRWSQEHPAWPRSRGAVGPANVNGAADDALLLRIPAFQVGSFTVVHVATASRPDRTYSATSFETPAPIVGALGGNVLSQFRVEIDYPEQLLFLKPSGKTQANDFDTVGLVLDADAAGELVVRAVSSSASSITRQNVLPGDVILQIGNVSKAPYTLTKAARALSGAVGERKQLRILRKGKPMTVTATVSRIV
jgi:Aspartyl protease